MRYILLISMFLLGGCGTLTYKPYEYALEESRVEDFPASGPISVENGVSSEEPMTIFDGVVTWETSPKELTASLTKQLETEIARHGVVQGDQSKNLKIVIDHFFATQPGFVFKVNTKFTVYGDNGFEKSFDITDTTNGSVGGNIARSFSSAVAVAAIHVLEDPDVLEYLKK